MKFYQRPAWQLKFHWVGTILWFIVMFIVPFMPPFQGRQHLAALLIMEISLYANVVTHFGAVSSAEAAIQTEITIENVENMNVESQDRRII